MNIRNSIVYPKAFVGASNGAHAQLHPHHSEQHFKAGKHQPAIPTNPPSLNLFPVIVIASNWPLH